MRTPFDVLLWIRSLAIAAGLGPPAAWLVTEIEVHGRWHRPRAMASAAGEGVGATFWGPAASWAITTARCRST